MSLRVETASVNPTSENPSDKPSKAWATHNNALAAWANVYLVNRREVFGGYYKDKSGAVKPTTRHEELTLERLARHFAAKGTDDIVGLHAIARDEAGESWSRWGAVDIDRHDDKGDPQVNEDYALAVYDEVSRLGLIPLLYDSNGAGGFHLVVVFDQPVPTLIVHGFMKWLTRGAKDVGLEGVETFPKQSKVTDQHPFGNWLRLPGRHHKRGHFTRVFDGTKWLEGQAAVKAIVSTRGGNPDLIPAEAREASKPKPLDVKPSKKTANILDDVQLAADALKQLNGEYLDSYDGWLNVGFALNSLGPLGLGLWDQWSQGSPKYEVGACRSKWDTFDSAQTTNDITLGSLFHWAKDSGWRDPRTTWINTPATHKQAIDSPDVPTPTNDLVQDEPRWFNTTDMGNGERLAYRHGSDLRYVKPWKKWLAYDGRRWACDRTDAAVRMAKQTVRAIYREAAEAQADADRKQLADWAHKSESSERLTAMMTCAQSEPKIPVLPETLDQHPWLLNCLNGTLDLETGKLRSHCREDLITSLCPVNYDPAAKCPLWESTLNLVFKADKELESYWQRLCGLILTGAVTEQILPIPYGTGANGKSTILGVMLDMLGPDLAMKAPPELLMVRRTESHPTERASLFGKRLVVAIETGEGARINETLVKELTGSDPITARRMREDFWTFKPTHKVLLCTNHKPVVRGTDHAIWRRLQLVPFDVRIDDKKADRDMPAKLANELPGILAWCIRGCLEWQKSGINPPSKVTEATEAYRQDEDVIGSFLVEHCTLDATLSCKSSALYDRYRSFTEGSGEIAVNQKKFGAAMTERGFERYQNNGTRYRGLGLRPV